MCLGEFSPSDESCITGICRYCGTNMRERDYKHLKDCVFLSDPYLDMIGRDSLWALQMIGEGK